MLTRPNEHKLFKWHIAARLMTVIRGIPMYRSSGFHSKFKRTWLPCMGIDGTDWFRKPALCLPQEIISYCKKIGLDHMFTLKRFGNTQSICISASIGTGIWETKQGADLKTFLKENYSKYFLSDLELLEIKKLRLAKHRTIKNVSVANHYLELHGAWFPVKYQSRLPSEKEYNFFLENETPKIRKALSMILVSKHPITQSVFEMICKLSLDEKLFDSALDHGLFEVYENIVYLKKALENNQNNLTKDDLIKLNPLYDLLLPPKYLFLKTFYAGRNIFRHLLNDSINEDILQIMEKLNDLNLLDRYSALVINQTTRRALFDLDRRNELSKVTVKKLCSENKNHFLTQNHTIRLDHKITIGSYRFFNNQKMIAEEITNHSEISIKLR